MVQRDQAESSLPLHQIPEISIQILEYSRSLNTARSFNTALSRNRRRFAIVRIRHLSQSFCWNGARSVRAEEVVYREILEAPPRPRGACVRSHSRKGMPRRAAEDRKSGA